MGGMNFLHDRVSFGWYPQVPLLQCTVRSFFILSPSLYTEHFELPAAKQCFDVVNFGFIKINLIFFMYEKLNAVNFRYFIIF
ncbi:hypothetical protein D3H55_09475 [Bacillus salacetis]|uniref:Uncharacterized protein n=1 Tax=Bacillus salacetis TaxID=2315464 RepID=A0A3A1R023_9BACI|nr:hypothetical protein [Bacillus salacetis]RIW34730.1 hypothetical protein D3H55_09475 [Bacillus salacetis]